VIKEIYIDRDITGGNVKITKSRIKQLINESVQKILKEVKSYTTIEEFILDYGDSKNVGNANTDITPEIIVRRIHDVSLPKMRSKYGKTDKELFAMYGNDVVSIIKDNEFFALTKEEGKNMNIGQMMQQDLKELAKKNNIKNPKYINVKNIMLGDKGTYYILVDMKNREEITMSYKSK